MIKRNRTHMRRVLTVAVGSLALPGLVACQTAPPTQQLMDARQAYEQAQASPASEFTPDELLEARQALAEAERASQDRPGSAREAHLAYVAERRAQIARARGESSAALHAEQQAQKAYQERLEDIAAKRATDLESAEERLAELQRRLEQVQGELDQHGEQLDARAQELQARESLLRQQIEELERERQLRLQVESERDEARQHAREALQKLDRVAQVRENGEATVITVPGQVLFAPGAAQIKPSARQRLEQVAAALREQDPVSEMTIVGHSDGTGPRELNRQLSEQRAERVAQFLIDHGVDRERLRFEGRGADEPVAPNDTSEGRAMNRRVEIIVVPGAASNDLEGEEPSQDGEPTQMNDTLQGTEPGTEPMPMP